MNRSSLLLASGQSDEKPKLTFKLPYPSNGFKVTRLKPAFDQSHSKDIRKPRKQVKKEQDQHYRSYSSSCVITPNTSDSGSLEQLIHRKLENAATHHRNISALQTTNALSILQGHYHNDGQQPNREPN